MESFNVRSVQALLLLSCLVYGGIMVHATARANKTQRLMRVASPFSQEKCPSFRPLPRSMHQFMNLLLRSPSLVPHLALSYVYCELPNSNQAAINLKVLPLHTICAAFKSMIPNCALKTPSSPPQPISTAHSLRLRLKFPQLPTIVQTLKTTNASREHIIALCLPFSYLNNPRLNPLSPLLAKYSFRSQGLNKFRSSVVRIRHNKALCLC
jgi:hypothetical protein